MMLVDSPAPVDKTFSAEYTPWYNRDEFVEVYECLYSDSLFDRERGIRKVSVWESRAHPTLPLGVSATAAVINAKLREDMAKYSEVPSIMNTEDFRLMYSSAITRFVNLLCEEGQRPGRPRISCRAAARIANLPEWIIDLRHEATHRKMPSVKLLRAAAVRAAAFLKPYYWLPELNGFKDFVQYERFNVTEMNKTISMFLECQTHMLCPNLSKEEKRRNLAKRNYSLKTMRKQASSNHNAFFEALVSPGAFLQTTSQLVCLLGIENDFFATSATLELPDKLIDFWLPVILMLCKINRLQEFLETLFESQNQQIEFHRLLINEWCRFLIDTDMLYRTDLQDVPEDERICYNWVRLMAACTRYPNKESASLLPQIMENIKGISNVNKGLLMALVAIHSGMTVSAETGSSPPKKRMRIMKPTGKFKAAFPGFKALCNSPIQVSEDDIDWKSVPLGMVLNPKPKIPSSIRQKMEQESLKPKTENESKNEVSLNTSTQEEEKPHRLCHIAEVCSEPMDHIDDDEEEESHDGQVITYPLLY